MNKKSNKIKFAKGGLFKFSFVGEVRTHTRTISPKLGILGLFGFLGFLGLIPQIFNLKGEMTVPFMFFFFGFFGFFGFYYEGKMSNTLIDERFQLNAYRAAAMANQVSLGLIIMVSIISISLFRFDVYDMLSILIAVIGMAFGLSVFLQQYLLYRFENEE